MSFEAVSAEIRSPRGTEPGLDVGQRDVPHWCDSWQVKRTAVAAPGGVGVEFGSAACVAGAFFGILRRAKALDD